MSDPQTKAFLASAGKTFDGATLSPLTPQRQAVAAEMGMKFGSVARYQMGYLFRDTIIVVWLCAQTAERVDEAEIEPREAMKAAYEWAEEKGINLNSPMFHEAHSVFLAMMKELKDSRGKPRIEHAADDDEGEA